MTARVRAASAVGFSAVGIHLGAWVQLTKNPDRIDELEHALVALDEFWTKDFEPNFVLEKSWWDTVDSFSFRFRK